MNSSTLCGYYFADHDVNKEFLDKLILSDTIDVVCTSNSLKLDRVKLVRISIHIDFEI
jgi:hypothetical protein